MARENRLETISLPASADLSAGQFKCVTVNSDGQIALTGDGLAADGVLQDKPAAAGRAACVATGGVTKVLLGGTVVAGQQAASGASGVAKLAATGNIIVGRFLEGGDAGQLVSMLIEPRGPAA